MSRRAGCTPFKGGFLLVEMLCAFFVLITLSGAIGLWFSQCCRLQSRSISRLTLLLRLQDIIESARSNGKLPAQKKIVNGVTYLITAQPDALVPGFSHVTMQVSADGQAPIVIKTGFFNG